jgi:hypothetical protein
MGGYTLQEGSNMSQVKSRKVALLLVLMALPLLLSLSGCFWRGGHDGGGHEDHHDR